MEIKTEPLKKLVVFNKEWTVVGINKNTEMLKLRRRFKIMGKFNEVFINSYGHVIPVCIFHILPEDFKVFKQATKFLKKELKRG